MELNCKNVIRGISGYLDHEISVDLHLRMVQHFGRCQHCTAILDGTRNVIALVGDGRSFTLPEGFGERLRARISPAG